MKSSGIGLASITTPTKEKELDIGQLEVRYREQFYITYLFLE